MAATKHDLDKALELLFCWLVGSGFSGFKFDTGFSLYFSRGSEGSFCGYSLPWLMELQLLGHWWFGAEKEWLKKIDKIGEGIEPDEPVKAFELTKLRWSEGALVKNVTYKDGIIAIDFANGLRISVSLESDDDYVLMLKETGVNEKDATWSVVCNGEDMYYRMPEG
jgi:hypothetical protein